jgi:DNA modification methylase
MRQKPREKGCEQNGDSNVDADRVATGTDGAGLPLSVQMASRIELWPTERLRPYDKNPRTHSAEQVAKIAASMTEFGFTNPVLVDSRDGIIAGHGRLQAAQRLGLEQVPVVVLDHLTDAQRRAYVIADNRLALDAGWDEDLLAAELAALKDDGFDLGLTGFGSEELDEIFAWADRALGDDAADEEAPEPPDEPVSRPGDLWILGRHRLLCGDSTNADHVARVVAGAAPRLLLTDPPYGVELDMEWRDRAGLNALGPAEKSYMQRGDGHRNTAISGDTKADWSDAFELVPSLDTAYVWHASAFAVEVGLGLRRIGFDIKQQIIWRKPHFALSRQHYHWQHEPCWYARKDGSGKFRGTRDQGTVWDAASPKMLMNPAGDHEEKVDHPTQKPLSLYTRPIENHLAPGGCFYEPFGGSGTAIAAAEKTGRRCIAIELDPRFVDVIVLRWQRLSGKDARLEGSKRTFGDVAAERQPEAA